MLSFKKHGKLGVLWFCRGSAATTPALKKRNVDMSPVGNINMHLALNLALHQ